MIFLSLQDNYIHPLFQQTTQSTFMIHLHSMASRGILTSLNLLLLDPQTGHSINLLIPLPLLNRKHSDLNMTKFWKCYEPPTYVNE